MTRSDICAVIVMGVSGSGKSTVAKAIAERTTLTYVDGDDFHPEANVEKMRAGHPLDDRDRAPWLKAIADAIDRGCANGEHLIVACSALKRAYRDVLVHGRDDVRIVFLEGTRALIADRLAERKNHFMPAGLLDSQFAALELPAPDEKVIRIDIAGSLDQTTDSAISALGLRRTEAR